jgi:hypothetical protein
LFFFTALAFLAIPRFLFLRGQVCEGKLCEKLFTRLTKMNNSLFRISIIRPLLLIIPILFSAASASEETDSLLFYLSVNGPVIELGRCIEKSTTLNLRRADGITPLIAAVQANNLSTITVLLEHGADASMADSMNFDPLYWALHNGFFKVADVLLAHGVDVDRPNAQGNSPLMSAVMRGDLATAHYLLSHGADKKRMSSSGSTPRTVASRNRDAAMVSLLSSFKQAEPGGPAADTGANKGDCSFTDAKIFFAAIQSGRRSFQSCALAGLDLKGMRLYGLDFKDAILSGCDLRCADMRYCDLSGAALRNAYLHGADLRNAQMDNTDFSGAMLTGADLRDAKGLSFDQLRSARNLYRVKLDNETMEVMQREYPKHFKDPGGAWNVQAKATSNSR